MGLGHSPRIVTDGLVLCLDAANRRSLTGESLGTLIESISVSSVTGSGPSYTVTYSSTPTGAQTNDKVIVEKRDAGAGTASAVLSIYTYTVTATNLGSNQLTIQYSSDTAGLGDDSPNDLYSGGGSSGSPEVAPHKILRPDSWLDISKGGNDGFMSNMDYATNFSSANGGSLGFDGTNEYVALGNASNFISSSQNTATVCAWVKPDSTGSYKKIFSVCNSGTNQIQSFYFSIGPSPYNVYIGLKTSSAVAATQNVNLSTTEFTYLCGVYNGSTIKLYRNGIEVASQNQTGNIPTTGVGRISGYDNGAEVWPGYIASFSMYNKALTADEVRRNYLATKERYA